MKNFSDGKSITALHVGVAEELLKWINAHRHDRKPITYGNLAAPFGINPQNLRTYLGDLSIECHTLGLPLISAIVVIAGTSEAGTGFFELMAMLGYSNEEYEAAKDKVFTQKDWQPLKNKLGI